MNENKNNQDKRSAYNQLLTETMKDYIDLITDIFPKTYIGTRIMREFTRSDFSGKKNAFVDAFIQCVIDYPYELDTLRKISSNALNNALSVIKDDKEYYALAYFAIGKVYLYYGLIEKAYDYFFKFLEIVTKNKDLRKKHIDVIMYLSLVNKLIAYGEFDEYYRKLSSVLNNIVNEVLENLNEKTREKRYIQGRLIVDQGNDLIFILEFLNAFFDNDVDFDNAIDELFSEARDIVSPTLMDGIDIILDLAEEARSLRIELENEGLFKQSEKIVKKINSGEEISDEENEIIERVGEYFAKENLIIFYTYFFADLAPLTPFFISKENMDYILSQVFPEYRLDATLLLMGAYHVAKLKKSAYINYLAGMYYYFREQYAKAIRYLEEALKLKLNQPYVYRALIKSCIIKRTIPKYLKKVKQYINELIENMTSHYDAYFIIGAEIMCNVNLSTLRQIIAKLIKNLDKEDKKLLLIYDALKNVDAQISTIIRESISFINEYEQI
ncbi:MAG: hypothetical protein ACP6IU_12675 [Candidatus Asgardarchaeia archaeon]